MQTSQQTSPSARHPNATGRGSLAARVTGQIRAALEQGVRPWVRPWNAERAGDAFALPLRSNGVPYKGVNVLILWAAALDHGYASRSWYTFKQAKTLGASVRQGEHGKPVVFYSAAPTPAEPPAKLETPQEPTRSVLRTYVVFNADQIDGLPSAASNDDAAPAGGDAVTLAKRFARVPARVEHGGPHAFYVPSQDFIRMPPQAAFPDVRHYYATLTHELAHWTRHPTRLDRDLGSTRFGDTGYAREELVALS